MKNKNVVIQSILELDKNDLNFVVASSSMLPVLKEGDKIKVEKVSFEDISVGHVVVYKNRSGKQIVHRVIKKRGDFIITAGDNLRKFDEPVHIRNVIGVVIGIERRKPQSRLSRFCRALKRRTFKYL